MLNLRIENIGKLNKIDIDLEGITILGAKNDSGKSTISKVLGTSINAINNYENLFESLLNRRLRRRIIEINGILSNNFDNKDLDTSEIPEEFKVFFDNNENIYDFPFEYDKFSRRTSDKTYNQELNELIKGFKYLVDFFAKEITKEDLEKLHDLINSLEKLMKDRPTNYKRNLISEFFIRNFKGSIKNFHNNNGSKIEITQNKNVIFEAHFNSENRMDMCNTGYSELKNVVYIESPIIIDKINRVRHIPDNARSLNFENNLIEMLLNEQEDDLLDEENENKNKVLQLISQIVNGKLEKDEKGRIINRFKFKRGSYEIETSNLATGIKSFVTIQLLLENNWLNKECLLIIDEPEVHLHPEWQVKFAEVLVLLNKYLNVNIYLNTHSTYIIEAFQVLSTNYDIEEDINYYMLESNGFSSSAKSIEISDSYEINDSLYELYDQLNGAFSILDDFKLHKNLNRIYMEESNE